jgi:hypothetical protein
MKATLNIPGSGSIGPSVTSELPDAIAISYGRIAAGTLSEGDQFVTVTLGNGSVMLIGHNAENGALSIGRLEER